MAELCLIRCGNSIEVVATNGVSATSVLCRLDSDGTVVTHQATLGAPSAVAAAATLASCHLRQQLAATHAPAAAEAALDLDIDVD